MLVFQLMIIAILILLGLCFGSFINALVWRMHQQDTSSKKKKDKAYSIVHGHSMCPKCQHRLSALDLMPIVSWVALKGKCRYCHKKISWQYPLVELATALLFVGSYLFWPLALQASWQYVGFIGWLAVLIGLIALTVYDIKWMILPDKINYALMALILLSYSGQFILGRPLNDIYGMIWAVIIGGGVFWLIFQISKGKWIGGGDVKLGFLLGLIVAKPEYAFLTLFMASVIAMLFTLPFLLTKKLKRDSKVPFGPFLITACLIVVLFGPNLLSSYNSLLGL